MQRGPERVHPVFSKTWLGGARRRGNLVHSAGGGGGGHVEDRRHGRGHCRHRHHQPAGDYHCVGQGDRRAGVPGDCLAVPPDLRLLRLPQGQRAGGPLQGKDGPGNRRLFFRNKAEMDSGPCGGSPGTGRAGRAAVRNGGNLADLEADQGPRPCD